MQQDKPRCAWAKSPLMQAYHDTEWGVPTRDDGRLYEMLLLEAFQAGFPGRLFSASGRTSAAHSTALTRIKVAAYGEDKVGELLKECGHRALPAQNRRRR